jgi:ubiquitin-like protein ATG12
MQVMQFLRRALQLSPSDSLYVYCNAAFVPHPADRVADMAASFAAGDELILNYSLTPAYG